MELLQYVRGAGSQVKHGKLVGYIVADEKGNVGSVCRGLNDPKRGRILLNGKPVTLFRSRRAAQRAIDMDHEDRREERLNWRIKSVGPMA